MDPNWDPDWYDMSQLVDTASASSSLKQKVSLADTVYKGLKTRLFAFSMPPGERYSESDLAASLDVSRTPLRLALRMLERDGLVENVGGHSCWRVRPLDLEYYEDLYDFRVDLEALAMRRLGRLSVKPNLSKLLTTWRKVPAGDPVDGETVAERDEVFHLTLVDLCGNNEMARVFRDLTDRIRTIRRLDFVDPARIIATYREHSDILHALERGSYDDAERLLTDHIERSRTEIRHITLHRLSTVTKGAA